MQSWALVTGATAGIGESFTRLLAQNGYNIVLVARDLPRLQERAKGLESTFGIATKVIQREPLDKTLKHYMFHLRSILQLMRR